MVKYSEYKKQWYVKKKLKFGLVCSKCSKPITWRSKVRLCGSCASKERAKKFPPPSQKGLKHEYMVGNKFGKGLLPWNAGKPRPEIRGANHPRWKGGIGRHGRDIEKSRFEYKEWRRKVFE